MDRQALCEKTKIHGNIESKQDAERNDDGTPKKLPNSNFADDSYSRNEKILRFFAAFGVPFQAVIFFGFRIGSGSDRIQLGSDPPPLLSSYKR
ncbi:hypothetical protein L596_026931 [Steinernema carpocapsae]|uniref:Uncharacterized protein n=1 Tax=Steinernema carpocapsae TaxID=34508 RepID=A0A4U5M2S8_STECR|nr:hypothetical protein L596_026931 [Steinernema carpocapsae]